MQLKDYTTVKDLLAQYPTPSLFFFRELDEVTSVQLLSALMRLPNIPQAQVLSAWRGLKPPKQRFMMGEIKDYLTTFKPAQRKALLFGLEASLSLEEVMLLKWKKANKLSVSSLAKRILQAQPRHLFTDFTFWEYGKKEEALPLMTLAADFARHSTMTWQALSEHYQNAIMVDSASDTRELREIISTFS